MNVEGHRRAIRESLEEIREAVQKGVMERQRTIRIPLLGGFSGHA